MNWIAGRLYNLLGVPSLYVLSYLYSLFNEKVRRGLEGRKILFEQLAKAAPAGLSRRPRFWIHNSSMGEFEQAKPLVEALKAAFPGCFIAVSFFSPSAYEHVQDYPHADCLCYLPIDDRRKARRFLDLIRPDAAIVIRHDIWPNHLLECRKRRIPTVLVNSSIRHESLLKNPLILHANRFLFGCFDHVLAVSQESIQIFRKYRLGNARLEAVGDTRYDRVVQRAREAERIVAPLRKLKNQRKGFVMGSTWPSDEAVLFSAVSKLRRQDRPWMVIVPHEPVEECLCRIEQQVSGLGLAGHRLSAVESGSVKENDVLIVDRIGILASLYALGDLAFVGGGFGPGVHNVLEPAALGKGVLYGPRCRNSYEAGQLEKRGVGHVVNNDAEAFSLISRLLQNPEEMASMGRQAASLMRENVGATQRIVGVIQDLLPGG
ncbi:hypothetical protein JW906_11150 [bacterium]|nr:hypothetical protein [bacterium]